jgi:hypothetical protein
MAVVHAKILALTLALTILCYGKINFSYERMSDKNV